MSVWRLIVVTGPAEWAIFVGCCDKARGSASGVRLLYVTGYNILGCSLHGLTCGLPASAAVPCTVVYIRLSYVNKSISVCPALPGRDTPQLLSGCTTAWSFGSSLQDDPSQPGPLVCRWWDTAPDPRQVRNSFSVPGHIRANPNLSATHPQISSDRPTWYGPDVPRPLVASGVRRGFDPLFHFAPPKHCVRACPGSVRRLILVTRLTEGAVFVGCSEADRGWASA